MLLLFYGNSVIVVNCIANIAAVDSWHLLTILLTLLFMVLLTLLFMVLLTLLLHGAVDSTLLHGAVDCTVVVAAGGREEHHNPYSSNTASIFFAHQQLRLVTLLYCLSMSFICLDASFLFSICENALAFNFK